MQSKYFMILPIIPLHIHTTHMIQANPFPQKQHPKKQNLRKTQKMNLGLRTHKKNKKRRFKFSKKPIAKEYAVAVISKLIPEINTPTTPITLFAIIKQTLHEYKELYQKSIMHADKQEVIAKTVQKILAIKDSSPYYTNNTQAHLNLELVLRTIEQFNQPNFTNRTLNLIFKCAKRHNTTTTNIMQNALDIKTQIMKTESAQIEKKMKKGKVTNPIQQLERNLREPIAHTATKPNL